MSKTEKVYQSWCGDSPIFYRNGRRINLESGYNLAIRFDYIKDNLLHQWFKQHCKIIACDSPFLIANDLDAPKERMVTQCSQYIHRNYVGWGKVGIDRQSTNIEAFGFRWQGMDSFTLHPWYFVEKIKGGGA